MKVFLSRKAAKALDAASPQVRRRLRERISELLSTPYPTGCRKPKRAESAYRLRVGDYRVLYVITSKSEILIFKIARRETAYE